MFAITKGHHDQPGAQTTTLWAGLRSESMKPKHLNNIVQPSKNQSSLIKNRPWKHYDSKQQSKCSGCPGKVTPSSIRQGEDNWEVDIENPGHKILTVVPETGITGNDIIKAVEEAGYKAEKRSIDGKSYRSEYGQRTG